MVDQTLRQNAITRKAAAASVESCAYLCAKHDHCEAFSYNNKTRCCELASGWAPLEMGAAANQPDTTVAMRGQCCFVFREISLGQPMHSSVIRLLLCFNRWWSQYWWALHWISALKHCMKVLFKIGGIYQSCALWLLLPLAVGLPRWEIGYIYSILKIKNCPACRCEAEHPLISYPQVT